MNILICGGDSRQLYAAKRLKRQGFTVTYTLFDKAAAPEAIEPREALKKADAVLLPLPVCRSERYINAPLSDRSLPAQSLCAMLKSGQTVFGGMLPFTMTEELYEKQIRAYDYYKDETVIERNALLTAEGILGILISETPRAVNGAKYLITGWGRCAKAAAKLLKSAGSDVTVAARRPDARDEAAKEGFKTMDSGKLTDTTLDFNAVINTVPHRLITRSVIKKLNKDTAIIEIASAPFGTDFDAAEELEIRVIKAPSLPGKTSPQTAGEIIADFVRGKLKKEDQNE